MGREFLRRVKSAWMVLRTGRAPKVEISAFEWIDMENTMRDLVTVKGGPSATPPQFGSPEHLKLLRESPIAERNRLFHEEGIQPDWAKYWADAKPSDPRADGVYRTKYPPASTRH